MQATSLASLDQGEESGPDHESYKELCLNLRTHSKRVESELDACIQRFKALRRKVQDESPGFNEVPLQPRRAAAAWLQARNLEAQPLFQDFFTAFLKEHAEQQRLDLSARTIQLNPDALALFGYPKRHKEAVPLLDLLAKLPDVFH